MAHRKMTPEQYAARAAKAKATREANKKAALAQMGLKERPKKTKRARKPMTEKQKKAAAARLEKARAAKKSGEIGQSKYSIYAPEVVALPDDHPLCLQNVRGWIKANKEQLQSMRGYKTSKIAKERELYQDVEAYVANLESYLRSGIYQDFRYGEHRSNKLTLHCVVMAYNADGTPKRSVNVWYPDIGRVWTEEDEALAA